MNISGKTQIVVCGKVTRVCSNLFNTHLKRGKIREVRLISGEKVVPSKNLSWDMVAKAIRCKKKVQAKVLIG